jgi:hypothetical protein
MWKVIYQNDVPDDSFIEWWEVTDGITIFKCLSEDSANWLAEVLNSKDEKG